MSCTLLCGSCVNLPHVTKSDFPDIPDMNKSGKEIQHKIALYNPFAHTVDKDTSITIFNYAQIYVNGSDSTIKLMFY